MKKEYRLKIGRFLFTIWVNTRDTEEFKGCTCYRVVNYEYKDVTAFGKVVIAWGWHDYTDEEFIQSFVSFICKLTWGKICSYKYICVDSHDRIKRVISPCPRCGFKNICDIDTHIQKCRNCGKRYLIR